MIKESSEESNDSQKSAEDNIKSNTEKEKNSSEDDNEIAGAKNLEQQDNHPKVMIQQSSNNAKQNMSKEDKILFELEKMKRRRSHLDFRRIQREDEEELNEEQKIEKKHHLMSTIDTMISLIILLQNIEAWDNIITENNYFWGSLFFTYISPYFTKKDKDIFKSYSYCSQYIHYNDNLKKFIFLILFLDQLNIVTTVSDPLWPAIENIDNQWVRIINENNANNAKTNYRRLFDSLTLKQNTLLKDSILNITQAAQVPLCHKFTLLTRVSLNVSKILTDFPNGENIIYSFLFEQKPKNFLKSFIFLSQCALKNSLFYNLCTKEEKDAWKKLENVVNEFLLHDINVYNLYLEILKRLYKFYPIQQKNNEATKQNTTTLDSKRKSPKKP